MPHASANTPNCRWKMTRKINRETLTNKAAAPGSANEPKRVNAPDTIVIGQLHRQYQEEQPTQAGGQRQRTFIQPRRLRPNQQRR